MTNSQYMHELFPEERALADRRDTFVAWSARLRKAADSVDQLQPDELPAIVETIHDFLSHELIPTLHADWMRSSRFASRDYHFGEYPQMHVEIEALTDELALVRLHLEEAPSRETLSELRQVLYALVTLARPYLEEHQLLKH